ncbi:MAG: hypothetical protein L0H15_04225 [Nitrosospira sp.]|nr:hypothetical protein [Nitrosospira sp.]
MAEPAPVSYRSSQFTASRTGLPILLNIFISVSMVNLAVFLFITSTRRRTGQKLSASAVVMKVLVLSAAPLGPTKILSLLLNPDAS